VPPYSTPSYDSLGRLKTANHAGRYYAYDDAGNMIGYRMQKIFTGCKNGLNVIHWERKYEAMRLNARLNNQKEMNNYNDL
jgi:hypothetical protein